MTRSGRRAAPVQFRQRSISAQMVLVPRLDASSVQTTRHTPIANRLPIQPDSSVIIIIYLKANVLISLTNEPGLTHNWIGNIPLLTRRKPPLCCIAVVRLDAIPTGIG